eukprot:scaffold11535_cov135-Isochrysis_galbana.AAC.3
MAPGAAGKTPVWFSYVARAHRWVAPLTNTRPTMWRLDAGRQALRGTHHPSLTHPTDNKKTCKT